MVIVNLMKKKEEKGSNTPAAAPNNNPYPTEIKKEEPKPTEDSKSNQTDSQTETPKDNTQQDTSKDNLPTPEQPQTENTPLPTEKQTNNPPPDNDIEKITTIILDQIQELNNNVNDKIKEVESKIGQIRTDIDSFKKNNTDYSDKITSIEKNVEKFIGLYELVTNQFNPFVKGNDLNHHIPSINHENQNIPKKNTIENQDSKNNQSQISKPDITNTNESQVNTPHIPEPEKPVIPVQKPAPNQQPIPAPTISNNHISHNEPQKQAFDPQNNIQQYRPYNPQDTQMARPSQDRQRYQNQDNRYQQSQQRYPKKIQSQSPQYEDITPQSFEKSYNNSNYYQLEHNMIQPREQHNQDRRQIPETRYYDDYQQRYDQQYPQTQPQDDQHRIIIEDALSNQQSQVHIQRHPNMTREQFVQPLRDRMANPNIRSQETTSRPSYKNEPNNDIQLIDKIAQKVESHIKDDMEKDMLKGVVDEILKRNRINGKNFDNNQFYNPTNKKKQHQIKKESKNANKPENLCLHNGIILKNIEGLYYALSVIDNSIFRYHVNNTTNDFADWSSGFDTELGSRLAETKSKSQMIKTLKEYLNK